MPEIVVNSEIELANALATASGVSGTTVRLSSDIALTSGVSISSSPLTGIVISSSNSNSLHPAVAPNPDGVSSSDGLYFSCLEVTGASTYVTLDSINIGGHTEGCITKNGADHGGGIKVTSGASLTVRGGSIRNNRALSGFGGGLFIGGDAKEVTLEMVGVMYNHGTGGGIYYAQPSSTSTSLYLNSCQIHHNAGLGAGGGLYLLRGTDTTIKGSQIYDNTATSNGGGGYMDGGASLKLIESEVLNNAADGGGGFYVNALSETIASLPAGEFSLLILTQSAFSGNSASVGAGGDLQISTGSNNPEIYWYSGCPENTYYDGTGTNLDWASSGSLLGIGNIPADLTLGAVGMCTPCTDMASGSMPYSCCGATSMGCSGHQDSLIGSGGTICDSPGQAEVCERICEGLPSSRPGVECPGDATFLPTPTPVNGGGDSGVVSATTLGVVASFVFLAGVLSAYFVIKRGGKEGPKSPVVATARNDDEVPVAVAIKMPSSGSMEMARQVTKSLPAVDAERGPTSDVLASIKAQAGTPI